jgi:hypothetical protein
MSLSRKNSNNLWKNNLSKNRTKISLKEWILIRREDYKRIKRYLIEVDY